MTTYIFPLLALVVLCAFWAIFQVWLSRNDPDSNRRPSKCGGCGRQEQCGEDRSA